MYNLVDFVHWYGIFYQATIQFWFLLTPVEPTPVWYSLDGRQELLLSSLLLPPDVSGDLQIFFWPGIWRSGRFQHVHPLCVCTIHWWSSWHERLGDGLPRVPLGIEHFLLHRPCLVQLPDSPNRWQHNLRYWLYSSLLCILLGLLLWLYRQDISGLYTLSPWMGHSFGGYFWGTIC